MPKFTGALRDWTSERFAATLKRELLALDPADLPLHGVTTQGGIVDDTGIDATILGATDDDLAIRVTVGVLFTEIVGGCSCADEPAPTNTYCEMRITIDKATAEAQLSVIGD